MGSEYSENGGNRDPGGENAGILLGWVRRGGLPGGEAPPQPRCFAPGKGLGIRLGEGERDAESPLTDRALREGGGRAGRERSVTSSLTGLLYFQVWLTQQALGLMTLDPRFLRFGADLLTFVTI